MKPNGCYFFRCKICGELHIYGGCTENILELRYGEKLYANCPNSDNPDEGAFYERSRFISYWENDPSEIRYKTACGDNRVHKHGNTQIIFVRHGEPDYSTVESRGYLGIAQNFAELTARGRKQAEDVGKELTKYNAELIISSPYTRALQTAAIINTRTKLPLKVEVDMHEWIPDLAFQTLGKEQADEAWIEYQLNEGKWDSKCNYVWEEHENFSRRVYNCMRKYLKYKRIIVVCHGMVMRQFRHVEDIPYCGMSIVEFDKNSTPGEFVQASLERMRLMGYKG